MPGIFIALYAVAQVVASLQGLETYLGVLGALFIIGLCLYFRFTLPLTIAAFLCAKNVWGWHWFFALLFVAPGLAFLLPAIAGLVIASLMAIIPLNMARRARRRPVEDDGIIEGEYEEVFDPGARPSARPTPHVARTASAGRKTGGQNGWWHVGRLLRRLRKPVVYLLLFWVVGMVIVYAIDHMDRPDAAATAYDTPEPINDAPAYDASAQPPMGMETPAASVIPALDDADLQTAVSEFDRVYTATGMTGAADYSRDCHNRLAVSHMARDFDQCIGFDWAAALIENAASERGFPPDFYFRQVTSADSLQASARLLSDDSVMTDDRIQRIRAGTADALNRLGAAKAANNGYGTPPTETLPDSLNGF
ncbi:hypothetical protein [Sphingobium sp. YR768]|uniref:hypothetical protein n=1 Tax=Sphingobium sp. YR768 TaxID=1884365 RepID=UPI0008C246A9|nr:hypothetical protein [Sphingobium sp. YR768]SEQ54287.1 hypothetical protein SAMN05518866_101286 [Sphingobium sp. YR768]